MKEHEVQFGTLHPDGSLTNIRYIKQKDMLKCPHCIMVPSHYREDGSCKCDDPVERKMMIREWGYKPSDFPKPEVKLKFTFLSGDVNWMDYGGKWISQELNSGEFSYWLVMEFINMDDACGKDNEGQPKYHVCVSAVSPQEAGQEGLEKAYSCCGLREDEEVDPLMQVEALHSYGISSPVWAGSSYQAKNLIAVAKEYAYLNGVKRLAESMGRAVNRIGSTGMEFLRGDITAGLARTIASGTPEGRILGKMYGVKEESE